MIPEQNKEDIVQSGIIFMRSITEAYGTDEGIKLWDSITSALDPDIKGKIFFALLTGDFEGNITISDCYSSADRIRMIKAVRLVGGLGLKEAKDLCDDLVNLKKSFKLKCDWKNRAYYISELRAAGFVL